MATRRGACGTWRETWRDTWYRGLTILFSLAENIGVISLGKKDSLHNYAAADSRRFSNTNDREPLFSSQSSLIIVERLVGRLFDTDLFC